MKHYRMTSLSKALDVLTLFNSTEQDMSVSEISSLLKINVSTVHRTLLTLREYGFIEQNERNKRYYLGLEILTLAGKVLDHTKLRQVALTHLLDLSKRTGLRVNLGVIHRGDLMYLGGVEKPSLPTIYSHFGKKAPVHASSLGKVIAAFMPKDKVEQVIKDKGLVKYTPKTITDFDLLMQEFELIRTRGYAIDNEEHVDNIFCMALPIRDFSKEVIASISLSTSDFQELEPNKDSLAYTAELISHLMGFSI